MFDVRVGGLTRRHAMQSEPTQFRWSGLCGSTLPVPGPPQHRIDSALFSLFMFMGAIL